jgi:glycosyltransferase involved in cell wall biosynthesis
MPHGKLPHTVFVSWCEFHGRSDGIARALGIRAWFPDAGTGAGPLLDIRRWRETVKMLRAERPEAIIVMQPPIFALWSVLRYARRNNALVAGDLHTGVFDDPNERLATRPILRILRRRGFAIVTNDTLKNVVESAGCRALVLHDTIEERTPDLTPPQSPQLSALAGRPYVLVPLRYAYDEPITELLAAASSMPDVVWVFTGRAPRKVEESAPGNAVFPGYISNDDFFRALSQAAAVVAMTCHEHTMQRAAYEALSYGRPLVTANTAVLTEYYQGYAFLSAPVGTDIARAVRQALEDPEAASRMAELRARKITEQDQALDLLRHELARRRHQEDHKAAAR